MKYMIIGALIAATASGSVASQTGEFRYASLYGNGRGASSLQAQNFAIGQVRMRCASLQGTLTAPPRTSVFKAGTLYVATANGSCRYSVG